MSSAEPRESGTSVLSRAAEDRSQRSSPAANDIAAFARLAWTALAIVLLVILFGAVVRITGSGAGCGQHWPSCNGEVVHLPKTAKTAIEYTHRLTSGLSLLFVLALSVQAFRRFARGHLARKAAVLALAFMLTEALIGAALVRLGLVENNASALRALVMSLHLVNTSALIAALAIVAWASREPSPRLPAPRSREAWLCVLGLLALLAVSLTGAVTALGDTLYPVQGSLDVAARLASDHANGSHFLQQLRVVHPVLAFATGSFLVYLPLRIRDSRAARHAKSWALFVLAAAVLQLCAGAINVWLSAPGYMQVIHLAIASTLWLLLTLTTASLLYAPN